jgi:hypothetical protein
MFLALLRNKGDASDVILLLLLLCCHDLLHSFRVRLFHGMRHTLKSWPVVLHIHEADLLKGNFRTGLCHHGLIWNANGWPVKHLAPPTRRQRRRRTNQF